MAGRIEADSVFETRRIRFLFGRRVAESGQKDSTNRSSNCSVAIELLPLFEKNPDLWKAVEKINEKAEQNDSIQEYLAKWKSVAPEAEAVIEKMGSAVA